MGPGEQGLPRLPEERGCLQPRSGWAGARAGTLAQHNGGRRKRGHEARAFLLRGRDLETPATACSPSERQQGEAARAELLRGRRRRPEMLLPLTKVHSRSAHRGGSCCVCHPVGPRSAGEEEEGRGATWWGWAGQSPAPPRKWSLPSLDIVDKRPPRARPGAQGLRPAGHCPEAQRTGSPPCQQVERPGAAGPVGFQDGPGHAVLTMLAVSWTRTSCSGLEGAPG